MEGNLFYHSMKNIANIKFINHHVSFHPFRSIEKSQEIKSSIHGMLASGNMESWKQKA